MTNGRRKGAAGEREAARMLEQITGVPCRRGRQYCGSPDSPDIVVGSALRIHPEVKRLHRIAAIDALRQAERDAAPESIPVAILREDGDTGWAVMVRADRLVELAAAIMAVRKEPLL